MNDYILLRLSFHKAGCKPAMRRDLVRPRREVFRFTALYLR